MKVTGHIDTNTIHTFIKFFILIITKKEQNELYFVRMHLHIIVTVYFHNFSMLF